VFKPIVDWLKQVAPEGESLRVSLSAIETLATALPDLFPPRNISGGTMTTVSYTALTSASALGNAAIEHYQERLPAGRDEVWSFAQSKGIKRPEFRRWVPELRQRGVIKKQGRPPKK
jgi:hypothetical protein